jgi:hypothetical protein
VRHGPISEYTPIGRWTENIASDVPEPEAEEVFYMSPPKGFTLQVGRITVEEGYYAHQVLGEIRLRPDGGGCAFGGPDKKPILRMQRKEAFGAGANAVICSQTEVANTHDFQACTRAVRINELRRGWAVRLASLSSAQGQ